MSRPPRREYLRHLGRHAARLALLQLFEHSVAPASAEAVPAGDYPFTLGVASGMPRPDAVVLWTRLAPRPHDADGGLPQPALRLRWELAEDDRFLRGLRSGTLTTLAEHAHSAHVEVNGLRSGATYFYRFMTADAVSQIGRTRTAPAAGADVVSVRLALASCQHYEQGWFAAHREIAGRELDFVLFVGDYIYESNNARYRVRPHEGPPPRTLAAYRARHATYKLDPDLRAAHAAHPWVLTWDDHEVEDDYASDHSALGLSPQLFLARRAAAYKAYFEHLPVAPGMAPQGPAMRIHERFSWGRLLDLWTLDGRQYRDAQACGGRTGGGRLSTQCEELGASRRTVFGAAQEAWLAQGLASSARRWKLLAQGSQISPNGIDLPLGRRIHTDGWDGYPAARTRLLQAIAGPQVRNVVCLGGDVHRHVAAHLRMRANDEGSPVIASEFTCSSVTSRGLSEAVMQLVNASNPDMLHGRSDERGHAFLEIRPEALHCQFRGTAFPVRADSRFTTQAEFRVEHGRPGALRV